MSEPCRCGALWVSLLCYSGSVSPAELLHQHTSKMSHPCATVVLEIENVLTFYLQLPKVQNIHQLVVQTTSGPILLLNSEIHVET